MTLKQMAIDIAKAFTKWNLWQGGNIPIASDNIVGIVKGGGNVDIAENGTMNVNLTDIEQSINALKSYKSGRLQTTVTQKTYQIPANTDTEFSFAVTKLTNTPLMWNLQYNFSSAVTLGCESVNMQTGRFSCGGFMRCSRELTVTIRLHVLWVDNTIIE